jgi:hypothetical protein
VRQQVAVGNVFLPGAWRRFYCIPSCQDLVEGKVAGWQAVPAAGAGGSVLAQWQRPPLALVFERPGGARVELGSGADVWRWASTLGCPSGAASYSIRAEADGLRVVRQPLLTETEMQPQPRIYRLTWYLAWQPAAPPATVAAGPELARVRFSAQGEALLGNLGGSAAGPALLLDLAEWPCLAQRRRATTPTAWRRNERSPSPCWASAGVQKAFRRVIRQIAGLGPHGLLVWRGLAPGPCWDPTHCDRQGQPLPHWDMDALLDLGTWSRQQLGPGWQVRLETLEGEVLPALAGLFAPTGFAASADETTDG